MISDDTDDDEDAHVETTFKGRLDCSILTLLANDIGEKFSAFTSLVSGRLTCIDLSFVWTNYCATVEGIK